MPGYFGDIRLSDTIDVKFCTVTTTGAPTQLAGSPVISAYPSNSTTQLTAGITLSVDFDSVTGLNNVRVVASGANGYLTATNYALIITTGTVGGTSVVGYEVGSFSIENRSAVMPTTAARTLDVSAGGEAGVDWANVGSPTTSLNLSGTTTLTLTDLTSTAQTEASAVPASTATLASMIKWMFLLSRNKITQTATTQVAKANDDSTTVGTSTVSDDATTFTRGKFS